jgi:DNA-directed RNA polymerase specialized sigma24 family protein
MTRDTKLRILRFVVTGVRRVSLWRPSRAASPVPSRLIDDGCTRGPLRWLCRVEGTAIRARLEAPERPGRVVLGRLSVVPPGSYPTRAVLKGVGWGRSEARSSAGFELLYERFRLPLYRFIRAMVLDSEVGEELTLKAFDCAYSARESYSDELSASAWLHGFAFRQAMAHLRRRRLAGFLPWRRLPAGDREAPGRRSGVELALGSLSPDLRAVALLSLYARLTSEEMAAILSLSEETVARRLHAATDVMTATLSDGPRVEVAWPR